MESTLEIHVSESALRELKSTMAKQAKSVLRIFVAGVGCSGPRFGMALDEPANLTPEDRRYERDGMVIAVDARSVPYLNGARLNYKRSLFSGGFQLQPAPGAVPEGGSCSCGSGGGCH